MDAVVQAGAVEGGNEMNDLEKLNHGHTKGDKILYHEDGYREFYLKYLGYSNLDYDCFIAEDEVGDVSDDWLWSAIVEER